MTHIGPRWNDTYLKRSFLLLFLKKTYYQVLWEITAEIRASKECNTESQPCWVLNTAHQPTPAELYRDWIVSPLAIQLDRKKSICKFLPG